MVCLEGTSKLIQFHSLHLSRSPGCSKWIWTFQEWGSHRHQPLPGILPIPPWQGEATAVSCHRRDTLPRWSPSPAGVFSTQHSHSTRLEAPRAQPKPSRAGTMGATSPRGATATGKAPCRLFGTWSRLYLAAAPLKIYSSSSSRWMHCSGALPRQLPAPGQI